MFTKTFVALAITFISLSLFSSNPSHKTCYFDEVKRLQSFKANNYAKSIDSMENILLNQQIFNSSSNSNVQFKNNAALTIPVVFHIIHNNGDENLSDSHVNNVLGLINDAFSSNGYYNSGYGVNTNISFCLASEDENGNASTGINHIQNALTDMALADELAVKNLSRWNANKYLNIWVVKSIGGGSIAGFSYLANNHGSAIDGVIIDDNYVSSSESNTAILVHEIGHYCNLYHTFEGGCFNDDCINSGDKVCDTAPDSATFQGPNCGTYNSCYTDADDLTVANPFNVDVNDMDYLFMDYSFYNCFSAFTQGQADRMYNSLSTFRSSLFANSICNSSVNSTNTNTTPLTVSYTANNQSICEGESIQFTSTVNVSNVTYNWTFTGANPSSSNNQNPIITFNNSGTFSASLTVTDNAGQIETANNFSAIIVNTKPAQPVISGTLNYCEDENFTALSTSGSNITWFDLNSNSSTNGNSFMPIAETTLMVSQNLNGCNSDFTMLDIEITETPESPLTTGATTFCEGDDLANIIAFGNNVEWLDVNSGNSTFGNIFNPTESTNLLITQAVNNCVSAATSLEITINEKPAQPIIIGKTAYCQGEIFETLIATGSNISWLDTENAVYTANNTFTPISNCTILTAQTINGCASDYTTTEIIVNDTTDLQFSNLPNLINNASPVVLSAIPFGGQFYGDGVFVNTFNPSLVNNNSATIFYTYTNSFGCTSTINNLINIETTNPLTISTDLQTINPLLPNLESIIPTNPTLVSNSLKIILKNNLNEAVNINLTSLNGVKISNVVASAGNLNFETNIDLSNEAAGMYYLVYTTKTKKITKRIFKEN